MTGTRPSAVIAGGGIGGLAAALALAKIGIASQVCERRSAFPEEGAGIQIGPNGTRILNDLGVTDLLRESVAVPDALSVRDGVTARELTRLPLGRWIADRHGAPYWTAHRRDLHAALRARAEAEPLVRLTTGFEIASFEQDGDGVRVTGTDGQALDASLLAAADGLWSGLRRRIAGVEAVAPKPVGKSAFRTVVPAEKLPAELTPNAVHIWLAPGGHVVHYPVNAGRDIALVVVIDDSARDIGWDAAASAETVESRLCGFARPLRSLVAEADGWRRWSLHDMAPLPQWTAGRAALLGDAAHPVLPFLAQGAVMALEDAATLAAHLAGSRGDVAAALAAYAEARRRRVARVAEASRRNGRIYHLAGAASFARDTVMAIAPGSRVMAGFDWLYGWRGIPC